MTTYNAPQSTSVDISDTAWIVFGSENRIALYCERNPESWWSIRTMTYKVPSLPASNQSCTMYT